MAEKRKPDQKSTPTRVSIVDYTPEYATAFRDLNYAWIRKYFEVEPADRAYLEDPEATILATGGAVLFALADDAVAGTCALISSPDEGDFELAKMAVDEVWQGHGIGYRLGRAILDRARQLGARRVHLESNSRLGPAIALYRKLGFTDTTGLDSAYSRCNVQMEYRFTDRSG